MKLLAAAAVLWASLLSAMAINGYPFIYWDSSNYVNPAVFSNIRSSFYALFVNGIFSCGFSLVGVAVVQSILVLALLIVLFKVLNLPLARTSTAAAATLAFSTAPAYGAFIMPDVFMALGVISLFCFLYHRHSGKRSNVLTDLLAALTVFAFCAHSSAPLVLCPLAVVFYFLLGKEEKKESRYIARAGSLLLVSAALFSAEGYIRKHVYHFGSAADAFVSARFAEEGMIEKYLPVICARHPQVKLCAYPPASIPRQPDLFLWGYVKDSVNIQGVYGRPGKDFSAFNNSEDDLAIINRTIVIGENVKLLRFLPKRIWQALTMHRSLYEMQETNVFHDVNITSTPDRLEARRPGSKDSLYRRSAQVNPAKNSIMRRYASAITFFSPIFLLLHLAAVYRFRKTDRGLFLFSTFALIAIAVNLVVYASLSSPVVTRYYDRLSWLSALVAAFLISNELRRRNEHAAGRP